MPTGTGLRSFPESDEDVLVPGKLVIAWGPFKPVLTCLFGVGILYLIKTYISLCSNKEFLTCTQIKL